LLLSYGLIFLQAYLADMEVKPMKILKLTLAISVMVPQVAYAKSDVIFSCETQSGKEVIFRDLGRSVSYQYGFPGKPDIQFSEPKASATKFCKIMGMGGDIFTHSINLMHGQYGYIVDYTGTAKNFRVYRESWHLTVSYRGNNLSHIECAKHIVDNIVESHVPKDMMFCG